jgi:hypothetical protein
MQIPKALEQMVAGLISDERAEKERVEAVLSQIHELTKDFYEPDQKMIDPSSTPAAPRYIEAPVTVDRELESQRKLFEAKGFPTDEADRRARGILEID